MADSRQGAPRQWLVELRVPSRQDSRAIFEQYAALDIPTLQIDTTFTPVPMRSGQADAVPTGANEEVVVIRVVIDDDRVGDLEAHPRVARIWSDTPIEPFRHPGSDSTWNVDLVSRQSFGQCPIPPCDCETVALGTIDDVSSRLGMDEIRRDGYRGAAIGIGIVDGGMWAQGRSELGVIPNVVGGWPAEDWGTIAAWSQHGNMTATDALGLAPEADIFDIRIAQPGTQATISAALAGFQWAIEEHLATGKPQILSNSWGIFQESWDNSYATDPNHVFTRKVVEAVAAGIVVLFAAGNCGETCPSNRCGTDSGPGRSIWGANGHPDVFTVGAANLRDELIGYSSQGPAALSPRKPDFLGISHFSGYFSVDTGTSAACPVIAGVTATLLDAVPGRAPHEYKAALLRTALDIGPSGWDQHSGAGIVRASAAYHELFLEFYSEMLASLSGTCH